jgi:hypothetical protein
MMKIKTAVGTTTTKIHNIGRGLTTTIAGIALLALSTAGFAEEMDHEHQHGHEDASAGSTASKHVHHSHGAGQWMFEYRFMRMDMEDLLDGTDSIRESEVTGTMMNPGPYMMAPTKMTMDMHMLMGMYGFNENFSLMVMLNYLHNDMEMVNRMGAKQSMDTSGMGDTQIGGMYTVGNGWVASLNLSVPTGSIDEEVNMTMMMGMPPMPMLQEVQAPYPMQLGSGTYDLIPSVTYETGLGQWNVGGQAQYTYHIDENDNDYTLGDVLEVGIWTKYAVNSSVIIAGRLDYSDEDSIDGRDPKINPAMAPTGDPDAQGGQRLDLTLDVSAIFGAHTFGIAYGVPVYQDLNGPQLEVQSIVTFSWQYMMM